MNLCKCGEPTYKDYSICQICLKIRRDSEFELAAALDILGKNCSKCKEFKTFKFFYNSVESALGKSTKCKVCYSKSSAAIVNKNKQANKIIKLDNKSCNQCNKILPVSEFDVDSRALGGFKGKCNNCLITTKSGVTEKFCPHCCQIKNISEFYKKNKSKDGVTSWCKMCEAQERRQKKDIRNKREKQRRKTNPAHKIEVTLRNRTKTAILKQGGKPDKRSEELWGCSTKDFIAYLESLFEPGMTLKNNTRHGWHIDHIIPCSSFDLTQESERLKCFHYTNQMPRWATTAIAKAHGSNQIGNLDKHDRLDFFLGCGY